MEPIEFIYATFIRTTPEKLWEALTNGDFSEKYWMGFRIELELKEGGSVRIIPPSNPEVYGDHAGKVLVCEPLRKLTYSFVTKDTPGSREKAGQPLPCHLRTHPHGRIRQTSPHPREFAA
jgi:uncharacterized protein YndB with AHSA1/START domain